MSRSLDLLLLGLVGGLGWWIFARDAGPRNRADAPPPTVDNAVLEAPDQDALAPGVTPPPEAATPGATPAAPIAVIWEVDDAALLAHPSFQFVVAEPSTGRLAPLAWQRTADGRVSAELAPGQRALGLALVHPALEVLAWLPLDPATCQPEELPLRLGARLARVAFDVRDPEGRAVDDARLSLRSAEPARTLGGAQVGLPVDAEGKVLVPRRAGVRIDVQSAHGTATVDDPVDGRPVQLTARGAAPAQDR